jgi:hypothetical protein
MNYLDTARVTPFSDCWEGFELEGETTTGSGPTHAEGATALIITHLAEAYGSLYITCHFRPSSHYNAIRSENCVLRFPISKPHDDTGEPVDWEIKPRDASPKKHGLVSILVESMRLEPLPDETDDAPLTIDQARKLHPGIAAVADLRDWLGVGVRAVCNVAGLAESTVYHWVDRPSTRPRASTVSGLLSLWALAGLVRDLLGESDAKRWWHSGNPTRLQKLLEQGPEYLRELQDQAAAMAGAAELPKPPRQAISQDAARSALQALLESDEV